MALALGGVAIRLQERPTLKGVSISNIGKVVPPEPPGPTLWEQFLNAYRRNLVGITADQLDVVVEIRTEWDPDTADDTRERFWNNDPDWNNDDRKGILSVGVINHKVNRKFGVCHLGTCSIKMTNVALTWLKSEATGIRNNIDLIGKWVCVYAGTGYTGTPDDGETMFPYFVGVIRSISSDTGATVTLNCEDATRELLEKTVQFEASAGGDVLDASYAVMPQYDYTVGAASSMVRRVRYDVNPEGGQDPGKERVGGYWWFGQYILKGRRGWVAPKWIDSRKWVAGESVFWLGSYHTNYYAIISGSWLSQVIASASERDTGDGPPEYEHLDRPVDITATGALGDDITAAPRRWHLEYGHPMSGQSYVSGQSTIGTFKTWLDGDEPNTKHYLNMRKSDGADADTGTPHPTFFTFKNADDDTAFKIGTGYKDGTDGWDTTDYSETEHGFNIDGDGPVENVGLSADELEEWGDKFQEGDRWSIWEFGTTSSPFENVSGHSYIESDEEIGDVFPLQIIYHILKYQMNLMTGIRRPLLTWGLDGAEETGGNSKFAVNKDSFDAALQDIVDYCGASPSDYLEKMACVGNYPEGTKWIDIIQDCLRACLCALYVDGSGSFNAVSLGGIEDASGVSSDDYIIGDMTDTDDFNLISANHSESREKLINHVTIAHKETYWGNVREGDNVYEDSTSIGTHGPKSAKLKIGWRIPNELADDIISEWYLSRYADARNKINMVCTLSGALNTAPGDPVVFTGESLIDDSVQGSGASLRCYERSLDPLGNKIKLVCFQDDGGLDFA